MKTTRAIRHISKSSSVIEGAGVHLKRAFGFGDTALHDPFLLLDDFRSSNPQHYIKGFPWHPHRGIETITYVLRGKVEHGDSLGNKGIIGDGCVQWMTAGSGIIHQEMPKGNDIGAMEGFQLWANLPASHKMMAPRYRDISAEMVPVIKPDSSTEIRAICGKVGDIQAPVSDIVSDPEYLDITIAAHSEYRHPTKKGYTVIAYVFAGQAEFGRNADDPVADSGHEQVRGGKRALSARADNETLVVFDDGDEVRITTENEKVRFLLISGKPIREPVAWEGPIVMNTQEELDRAFREYYDGTFVKK